MERFVRDACDRLNSALVKRGKFWSMPNVPACVLPLLGGERRTIGFTSPTPEGVEYVGRNHPLVEGWAGYLLEDSLNVSTETVAARCGLTITDKVARQTVILLLRLRYLLTSKKEEDLLAEECFVYGFSGTPSNLNWLSPEEVLELWETVEPVGQDFKLERKRMALNLWLSCLGDLEGDLEKIAVERANNLSDSVRRLRAITKEERVRVKPQLPMDILGVYVLQPR